MEEVTTERAWQSVHSDYLRFAMLSVRACEEGENASTTSVYVNRHVIEAIRYSYDCLEASVEFVFHMGRLNQLPIRLSENWLSRHMSRKWRSLSLSDRLGMLAFAWTGESFWQTGHQFQLFEDLKRVRDGLTHPRPFGTEREFEIITHEETADGIIYTVRRPVGEGKEIDPDWLVHGSRAVAQFESSPDKLERKDAEQALEILLRHLIRLEEIFFQRRTTWFGFYDDSVDCLLSTEELLETINCRFEQAWQAEQGNPGVNQ